ncbi:hypothetical protein FPOA_06632 [Fusarium poae]|uniref:Uncharacterized protein n=1 Tax=Fusarium poae TaxID=36050 RepID=A0A1B8AI52_FUSPO|nr:hypothetical protein FPOA_06632 [Fusarium poae]
MSVSTDATIHVNIRKRSLSFEEEVTYERKRRCNQDQTEIWPKMNQRWARIQSCVDQLKFELPTTADRQTKNKNRVEAVISLKAGELCLAYHKRSQRWLAVLLLPLTDLHSVGISGTIESLGLSKDVPSCVTFNVNSSEFEWRDGYGDGEAFSHQRKFPVACIMDLESPDRIATEWIGVEDLHVLDKSSIQGSIVPYGVDVRAFRERRTSCYASEEARLGNCSSILNKQSEDDDIHNTCSSSGPVNLPIPGLSATGVCNMVTASKPSRSTTQTIRTTLGSQSPGYRSYVTHHFPNRTLAIPSHCPETRNAQVNQARMPHNLDLPENYVFPKWTDLIQKPGESKLPGLIRVFSQWPGGLPERIMGLLPRKSASNGILPLPEDFKKLGGAVSLPIVLRD